MKALDNERPSQASQQIDLSLIENPLGPQLQTMKFVIADLVDDILIQILSLLSSPDILTVRLVRLPRLSQVR